MNIVNEPIFKANWTPADFDAMDAALQRNFVDRLLCTSKGLVIVNDYEGLKNLLGLPYTSEMGALWVSNLHLYPHEGSEYRYVGFAMGVDNKCYGMLMTKDSPQRERTVLLP